MNIQKRKPKIHLLKKPSIRVENNNEMKQLMKINKETQR